MTDSPANRFKNINPNRNGRLEEVVLQFREMLQQSDLRPGDRLPPERDLAKIFGVSRPMLRAAIRSLAAMGVLQARQGAGTFVVAADGLPTLDSRPLRLMAALHGFTSEEMFEARQTLEMAIAGLAAERANGNHLASVAEELAGMYASIEAPEEYLIHDMRFHQTIAAASGNRILTALMNMIATILFDARRKTVRRAHDLKESAELHRQIYQALRSHNPEAACAAMHRHLLLAQKAQQLEEEELLPRSADEAAGNLA